MASAKAKQAHSTVEPTHISVTFKIITPDQLRKITFTLSRLLDAGHDNWSVMFELDERADTSKDFQLVVQLQVDVDHDDSDKAAATANSKLDSDQHAQVLIASDVAKAAKKGQATIDQAREEAAGVISARSI
jgi:hypothetical protein